MKRRVFSVTINPWKYRILAIIAILRGLPIDHEIDEETARNILTEEIWNG